MLLATFIERSVANINIQLPMPLTKHEEGLLFSQICTNKEARNKLIEHNLRLVVHVLKRYEGKIEFEDLFQTGVIGLIKAVDSYNGTNRFATYAERMIESELLMFLRTQKSR